MKKETFTVVGLNHYISNHLQGELKKKLPLKVSVKREPGNPADENAIAVYAHVNRKKVQIGHLRRTVAKEMAPKLDKGTLVISKSSLTEIHPEDKTGKVEIGLNKGKIAP